MALIRRFLLFLLRLITPRPSIFVGARIDNFQGSDYLIITWDSMSQIGGGEFYIVLREKTTSHQFFQYSSLEARSKGELFYKVDDEIASGRTYIVEFKDRNFQAVSGAPLTEVLVPGGLQVGSSLNHRNPQLI